jgi:hypothetical protein
LRALVAAALLAGGLATAHEGGTDARGVVKVITAEELVVETTTGAELRVALVPTTEVQRGKQRILPREVRAGERVVVHAAPRGGRLEATLVRVAAARPQTPRGAPPRAAPITP